jgi:cytochrome c oxidase subunit 2
MADTSRQSAVAAKPGAAGKRLVQINGCLACHSADGTKLIGPTFKGLYGKAHTVITGNSEREIVADDDYIIKSIYEPNEDVVKGYVKGQMISYKEQLSEEDIAHIIEYLKTLE